jgi:hypothetical protein
MPLTRDEIIERMILREDPDTVLDLLMPTIEEIVEALMGDDNVFERNYESLQEYYESDF